MSAQRSLNVGDVVLAAFKICSDRWKELLSVTVKTVLPASIFGSLLIATYMPEVILDAMGNRTLDPDATEAALRAIPSSEWVNLAVATVVYILVTSIANVLALSACLHISLDHHEGRELSSSDALRAALKKLGSMLWLFTIAGLLTLIGVLLCILPGIWLFIVWSVAPVVLLREGLRGGQALGRSRRMVKPSFWLVLVVVALEVACLFVLQTLVGGIPGLLLPASADSNAFAVFFALSLGSTLAGLAGVALHAGITSELYFALHAGEAPGLPSNAGAVEPITPPPPPPPLP